MRRGWQHDQVILIDTDEGLSGTTRIDERPGMRRLYHLITNREIGTVACHEEDRLFRDFTQIQVNVFIQACLHAEVQVMTPFFTYDFAHPLHGDFHIRQFRYKSEMAADYIKSYILGRLTPAKTRMAKKGLWVGSATPVGYMVDMREVLADGSQNPNWRRYVPFEPYAEVVRAQFRMFIENGGNLRGTMRQIRAQGLSFPEVGTPNGFKTNNQFKRRDGGLYFRRGNFANMLTNPVYIGHWFYKGKVEVWGNHEPIVDEDTFFQAFNYLSQYTLNGETNPHYRPRTRYTRKSTKAEHNVEAPLLVGLIETHVNGNILSAHTTFERRNNCYVYVTNSSEVDGTQLIWGRRSVWIDSAVTSVFKRKLIASYDAETWRQATEDSIQVLQEEQKLKQAQIKATEDALGNLVASLEHIRDPQMIERIEERYKEMLAEKARYMSELDQLHEQHNGQVSLDNLQALFQDAVEKWDEMDANEQRNVLRLFVDRIVASDYVAWGGINLEVFWFDGTRDVIEVGHKPNDSTWTYEMLERLLEVVDAGASQLEIAAEFPTVKWYQIYQKIRKHRGTVRFSPAYLRKSETYEDFEASGGTSNRKGKATCSPWLLDETELLQELVANGATQIEIMRTFPYRPWIRIQSRIASIYGKGVRIPRGEVSISQHKTYNEYLTEAEACDTVESAKSVSESVAESKTGAPEPGSESAGRCS